MTLTEYTVICKFDADVVYDIHVRPQHQKILGSLELGQKLQPVNFIKSHVGQFGNTKTVQITADAVYKAFSVGCKIGILQKNNVNANARKSRYTKSFAEFCVQETISYWMGQLRGSRYKHLEGKTTNSTQMQYAREARRFDFWLAEKSFTFHQTEQTSNETFRRTRKEIMLQGIEHLLKLYQMPYSEKSDYVRIVKTYLLDQEIHKNKRAETMMFHYHVIRSYFEKNESPLDFKFNSKARYVSSSDSEEEVTSMSLEELMKLLTVGQPSITEKAVFLCKFHRGLDNSTITDRFNFEAWGAAGDLL